MTSLIPRSIAEHPDAAKKVTVSLGFLGAIFFAGYQLGKAEVSDEVSDLRVKIAVMAEQKKSCLEREEVRERLIRLSGDNTAMQNRLSTVAGGVQAVLSHVKNE